MAYEDLGQAIVKLVGGRENVNSVIHCTTRLRFRLKDEGKADTTALKQTPGVVTVVQSGGQYQVVIGNQVAEVFQAVVTAGGFGEAPVADGGADERPMSWLDRAIDLISSIFAPMLGLLAATGMIKGFNALFTAVGWLTPTAGTYIVLNAIGDAFFYFLPVLLGYSAARKFKLEPLMGMTIGAALVYPSIVALAPLNVAAGTQPLMTLFGGTPLAANVYLRFLGVPVIMMNYTSSVIPIIVAVWLAARWQRVLQRVIPTVVRTFLVPFFTLLVIVPLTLIVIGPLASWTGDAISAGVVSVYRFAPVLAGMLLGALWQVMVIFGLHWGLIPIAILNVQNLHYDYLLALMFGTTFAQIGAVLAVTLANRDAKVRSLGWSTFISGIFGVTEPAIYGVTLPRKKPFIMSCIAASISGGLLGLFGTRIYMLGGLGVFQFPVMIDPAGMDMGFYGAAIAAATAFVLGFGLTWLFARDSLVLDPATGTPESPVASPAAPDAGTAVAAETLVAPVSGTVIPLSAVKDEVFASGAMGQGLAVVPTDGTVYAPADGLVVMVFATKHAIGLRTAQGAEVLIHIGMDTVQLEGAHFTQLVAQGATVKQGTALIHFDPAAISAAGYDLTTPMIVTNTAAYQAVTPLQTTGTVAHGASVLTLTPSTD
ncbi:beta-glucoside-specific PTS transporter subunit IIABC [Lacticaseibacillus absianus]|uniref:beta-glucoside-specific PTS transporter subunit IIABC n=1 Tax=Lacticaseibacillus absianus TaxID=2729623 RepID=UPI0015CB7B2D|nr:beta-glucoside-specific PTS transporter subunit IIABC [Lacticaseibacillus absianus]